MCYDVSSYYCLVICEFFFLSFALTIYACIPDLPLNRYCMHASDDKDSFDNQECFVTVVGSH